jgi:hypothetical protein
VCRGEGSVGLGCRLRGEGRVDGGSGRARFLFRGVVVTGLVE